MKPMTLTDITDENILKARAAVLNAELMRSPPVVAQRIERELFRRLHSNAQFKKLLNGR